MSNHVYSEIYLHLNWHTHNNLPVLQSHVEDLTHGLLRQKLELIKGVEFLDLGGTDDHVHLAVRIQPFVTISEMVQELKGYTAYEANRRLSRKLLEWQRGYGVVSFGQQNLPWVLAYIQNQRDHHAKQTIQDRLERFDDVDETEKPAEAG